MAKTEELALKTEKPFGKYLAGALGLGQ